MQRKTKNRKYSTTNRITLIIKVPPMYQTFSLLLQVLLRLSYTPKLKNTVANRYKIALNSVNKIIFQNLILLVWLYLNAICQFP